MNNTERMFYLSSQFMMLSMDKEHNAQELAKISKELTALQTEMNSNAEQGSDYEISKTTVSYGFVKFTEKEIIHMPKSFRKTFRAQGCTAHVRKRQTGRYNCSYEIRYAKKPYNNPPISISATTLDEAKRRFIEKLTEYIPQDDTAPTFPNDFHGFAMYWFNNIHKRKVKEKTFDHDIKLYNRHIKEKFEKFKVKDIHMSKIQELLDNAPGKGKTAKDIHSLLKQILDCAVKHGIIKLNPIGMCFLDGYEQEHGTAISIENECKILNAYAGTEYELPFAVIFYTGLRPCEYTSAIIDGDFIKAENHKRKSKIIEYKRIPITPMLRPYLEGVTELNLPNPRILSRRLKKVLPEHALYDMRTTFETRCDQCKIGDRVIGLFMGNEIGKDKEISNTKLKKAYTDINDPDYLKYLFEEGQKFKY